MDKGTMDQLYMLELMVNKIIFSKLPVPNKKQVVIQARCGTIANMEIRTDVMGALETQERDSKRKDVDIDCGKSLVFPMNYANLVTLLNTYPLQISVSTKLETEPMGTADIPWSREFMEMVESSKDAFGYVTPVEMRDVIPLEKNGNHAGDVQVYVRLTFLGRNIDTHIQMIAAKGSDGAPGASAKQFLFKSNNAATTFQCQKYGLGSDTEVIPVAPIYGMSAVNKLGAVAAGNSKSIQSIMAGTSIMSTQSITPSVFMVPMGRPMVNQQYGMLPSGPSDIQSLRDVTHHNPFMNIEDLNTSSISASDSGNDEVDFQNITIEHIEKNLCRHPDCPAAKLFQDFGIGPLAKGNGLGGIYKGVEAPISYGMSHMNGTIENYGPLGTYSRPKSANQPFIPKSDGCEASGSIGRQSEKDNHDQCGPLRLNGGGPISCVPVKQNGRGPISCDPSRLKEHISCDPLRLNGSRPISGDPLRLNGEGTVSCDALRLNGRRPISGDRLRLNGEGPMSCDRLRLKGPISWDPARLNGRGPICCNPLSLNGDGPRSCDRLSLNGGGLICCDPVKQNGRGPISCDPSRLKEHISCDPMRLNGRRPISVDPLRLNGEGPVSCDPLRLNGEGPVSCDPLRLNGIRPISGDSLRLNCEGPVSCDPLRLNGRRPISGDPLRLNGEGPMSCDCVKLKGTISWHPMRLNGRGPICCNPLRLNGDGPRSCDRLRLNGDGPRSCDRLRLNGRRSISGDPLRLNCEDPVSCDPLRLNGIRPISGDPLRRNGEGPVSCNPLRLKEPISCDPVKPNGIGPVSCNPLRLNGDGPRSRDRLSLSGGGPMSYDPLRLKGGGPICGPENIPDPRSVCHDLMEEFNRLLTAYKNALGPCGQPTCPFAPNLVLDTCRLVCNQGKDPSEIIIPNPYEVRAAVAPQMPEAEVAGCSVATCPFKREAVHPSDKEHKKKQSKPACGSPTCPYLRGRLGLEEEGDICMPPLPCTGKKCPSNAPQVELPPIHWDCPEPLPKGDCRNPECPYVRKQQLLDKYYPKPKATCGSPTCPYATAPCIFPGCPFNDPDQYPSEQCPPICPYTAPVPSKLDCTPSVCPFAQTSPSRLCLDPNCPYTKMLPRTLPPCQPCSPRPPKVEDDSCKPDTCPHMKPKGMSTPSGPYKPKRPPQEDVQRKGTTADDIKREPITPMKDKDICKIRSPSEEEVQSKDSTEDDDDSERNRWRGQDKDATIRYRQEICPDGTTKTGGLEPGNVGKMGSTGDAGDGGPRRNKPSCVTKRAPLSPKQGVCTKETCFGFSGDHVCKECGDMMEQAKIQEPDENIIVPINARPVDGEDVAVRQVDREDTRAVYQNHGKGPPTAIPDINECKRTPKRNKPNKSKDKKKKRRKKKRGGYVYDKGTYYPGNKIGHRECIAPRFNVPPDMGWLWNVHTKCVGLRPRMGWKPGAIGRTIAAMIDRHRRMMGLSPISTERQPKNKKGHKGGGAGGLGGGFSSSEDSIRLKPTLQVKKKDGVVYVTMNPLKDPKTLEDNENPYMDCSPMQFKIVKNKPAGDQRKKKKGPNGFTSCYCGGEDGEGRVLSSSSSSELDIEFTPPAGIIRPERLRKKKNVCHTDTQYNIEDCGIPPMEPKEPKPKKAKKGDKKGKKLKT